MALRHFLSLLRSYRYLDDHTIIPCINSSKWLMVLLHPPLSACPSDSCSDHRLLLHAQAGQWYQGLGDSICGREDDSKANSDSLCGFLLPAHPIHNTLDGAGACLIENGRVLGCVARGFSIVFLRSAPFVLLHLSAYRELDRWKSSWSKFFFQPFTRTAASGRAAWHPESAE